MKRWKKTRRERRRRRPWRRLRYMPHLQRMERRARRDEKRDQEARHAAAQERREKRMFTRLVKEWTDAGHDWPIAEALVNSEFDKARRDGWRVGKSGWWMPPSTVRRAIAKVV